MGWIMSYSLDKLVKSLENRIQEIDSGYIKLGFESGKLVAAEQYKALEQRAKNLFGENTDLFSVVEELKEASVSTFYGTLGFVFSGKKITNCYKSQSWKGSTLELFIGG